MAKAIAELPGQLRYPDKVVLVTGGTRGIGEACVKEFVCQGSKVVFCALECERERGEALERELNESGLPGEALFVVCDVYCEEDIKNLIYVTISHYGCLDCCVNNASIFPPQQLIDDVTVEDFKTVININAVGYFTVAKYALPHLRKRRGNIINLSSIVAQTGYKNAIAYSASKGAISAMTKALAIDESQFGVRVNSISPGNIETPMWLRIIGEAPDPEARYEEGVKQQLLGRLGTPEEVAKAVLYVCAEGTFNTGMDLPITGGVETGFGLKAEQDDAGCTKGVKASG